VIFPTRESWGSLESRSDHVNYVNAKLLCRKTLYWEHNICRVPLNISVLLFSHPRARLPVTKDFRTIVLPYCSSASVCLPTPNTKGTSRPGRGFECLALVTYGFSFICFTISWLCWSVDNIIIRLAFIKNHFICYRLINEVLAALVSLREWSVVRRESVCWWNVADVCKQEEDDEKTKVIISARKLLCVVVVLLFYEGQRSGIFVPTVVTGNSSVECNVRVWALCCISSECFASALKSTDILLRIPNTQA
jgi:hypothetical protein